MHMAGGISGFYDSLFTMLSNIAGSIFFSTAYAYPAQLIFLYGVYFISIGYLKTKIELVRLGLKYKIIKEALSKSPMINYF